MHPVSSCYLIPAATFKFNALLLYRHCYIIFPTLPCFGLTISLKNCDFAAFGLLTSPVVNYLFLQFISGGVFYTHTKRENKAFFSSRIFVGKLERTIWVFHHCKGSQICTLLSNAQPYKQAFTPVQIGHMPFMTFMYTNLSIL